MNSFRKLPDGSWGVALIAPGEVGQTVTITLRSGATKQVKLGAAISVERGTVTRYIHAVAAEPRAELPTAQVGEMSGILALFGKAKRHLKRPAIVLGVPELGERECVRLSVAGPTAKVPGSLTVTDGNKDEEGSRSWLGRILLDGTFQPSRECIDALAVPAIAARLVAFSADPVAIAGQHGRLTGRCCFCNRPLSDERSTAVGYGGTCAAHYDLPWGEERHSFAAPDRADETDGSEDYQRVARREQRDLHGDPLPNRSRVWG